MVDTTTLNENLRSPIDGSEFIRIATPGANWKITIAQLAAFIGVPVSTGQYYYYLGF